MDSRLLPCMLIILCRSAFYANDLRLFQCHSFLTPSPRHLFHASSQRLQILEQPRPILVAQVGAKLVARVGIAYDC